MANKPQRKRAQNFSEAEKMTLINLIQQYKNILENKKSDAVTFKDKEKCWKIIEHSFNSRASGQYRSFEVLRSCWDNLKKKARKFFADEKMQLYETGGGLYESKSDVLLEHVREIIKSSVDGLTNNFDSDYIDDKNISKLPTISNTNLHETSTNDTMVEWLDENDNITDESMYEDEELNFLKERSAAYMEEELSNNVINIYTAMDYNNENYINKNQNDSDLNTDILQCRDKNSKQKGKMQKPQKENIEKTSAIGILTSNVSTPLKLSKLSKHEDSLKNNKERKQYKRKDSMVSKISQYNILGDSKIELVQLMVEDLKAKGEIEIQILKTQLEKEQLEVKILKKELELKENLLQSKQQKLRL